MDDGVTMGPKKSNVGKYIAVGCLGVVFIVLIALVIGGVFVANNWKTWAADTTTTIAAEVIKDSQLSGEDKRALIGRVEMIGEEFKNETISWEEMQTVFEALVESPILTVAVVNELHSDYFEISELSDEEKARAERINDRLTRGLYEERIQLNELQPVLAPISKEGSGNIEVTTSEDGTTTGLNLNLKPPNEVTADELRAFMTNAESLLEQKAIPDEPFDIDIIEEFDKAIEAAIGRRIVPDESFGDAPAPSEEAPEPAGTGAGG